MDGERTEAALRAEHVDLADQCALELDICVKRTLSQILWRQLGARRCGHDDECTERACENEAKPAHALRIGTGSTFLKANRVKSRIE
jgi:hypothetical protein